jgi:hypothetical protein
MPLARSDSDDGSPQLEVFGVLLTWIGQQRCREASLDNASGRARRQARRCWVEVDAEQLDQIVAAHSR